MDLMPLHPKIVHLPIALAVLMPLIAAGLLAAWRLGTLPRRTWWIAVMLQLLLVGSGIVSLRTGETDEEKVERLVGEQPIEAHEEAAEKFVWGAGVVLLLAVAAAAMKGEKTASAIAVATVTGTLVVLFLGYRTGEAGGHLVYQHGAASAYVAQDVSSAPTARVSASAER